jgi:hypothetical protein
MTDTYPPVGLKMAMLILRISRRISTATVGQPKRDASG